MTCKNCVHYDVCLLGACIKGITGTCLNFKDKSRFIELPCRVGDTVYVIYPDPRYNWGNKELKILELKVHAFRYFNNIMTVEIRGDGNYITWDIDCFGASVFLTPEEAGKVLEGYKENT